MAIPFDKHTLHKVFHFLLNLAACQQGFRVPFTTAAVLVHELIKARDEKRLLRYQKYLSRRELLIVDELGFVPVSARWCSRNWRARVLTLKKLIRATVRQRKAAS